MRRIGDVLAGRKCETCVHSYRFEDFKEGMFGCYEYCVELLCEKALSRPVSPRYLCPLYEPRGDDE